VRASECSAVW